jgi:S-adenosylmethionine:tRNA ribosyltransferase-isomerase
MGYPENPKKLSIESYDYPLPPERIAQYPLEARDRSKLLIYKQGELSDDIFSNLSGYLPFGSLIVFNETRVVHARLIFHKNSGSQIEIFCLEPLEPFRDSQQAFRQKNQVEWLCMVGNSKRWKNGALTLLVDYDSTTVKIIAERIIKLEGGTSKVRLSWSPSELTFGEVLELAGNMPLPPYITRKPVKKDELTYQTVYARSDGSVAAPTAGLHFTDAVLKSLKDQDIEMLKFILHVGAGTFKPLTSGMLEDHTMHSEQVYLPLPMLEVLRAAMHKSVIAVGTTTTRLLESLYWHGVKMLHGLNSPAIMDVGQWDPYDLQEKSEISREEALDAVIRGLKDAGASVISGKTSLMIAPGYRFRYPDILITNFHQPKSTLLLLIAAFIGKDWRTAYQYALDHDFRFLSYGDSCLFFRK